MEANHPKRQGLLIGLLVGVVFVFFSFGSFKFFESLEGIIYSIETRLDFPQSTGESRIAIVNIDEKSIQKLGPWPWPNHLIAEMVTILKNNGARFIGLDFILEKKERNQGLEELRQLQTLIREKGLDGGKERWLLERLEQIDARLDNDRILAQAIRAAGNVVLPVFGQLGPYDTEVVFPRDSFMWKNVVPITGGKAKVERYTPVNRLTRPFKELAENCYALGHINSSPDRILQGRVHLLFINFGGYIIPSISLRMALDYMGRSLEEAIVPGKDIHLDSVVIPASQNNLLMTYKGVRHSFPYYSFVDILRVKNVPAVFNGKIVLIGLEGKGGDFVRTPVDPHMPHVEFTANALDNFIEGRFLNRPPYMIFIEAGIILALCILSALILPRFTLVNRLGVTAIFCCCIFLIGVFSFLALNVWLKTIYIIIPLVVIYVVLSIKDFVLRERYHGWTSKESIETNRMLGLSLQSQGLLDLAFEKFRKCPLDDTMKDVVYNLGLDYERKRMVNKAIAIYEYITQVDPDFRDLKDRIPKLRKLLTPMTSSEFQGKKETNIAISNELEIKPTIGRYEILGELGQGAMGIVYKARDPKINRLLAIKTIRFSDEFEDDRVKEVKDRFFREAEIAGKLSHPNIVSIYDVGEDYDLTYLAMEYLEGESLHKYCQKGALLPLRIVLSIMVKTAAALEHAHRQGVIHRDIKPANIMFLKNGKVKVTDFGIAKAVSTSQTKSGIVLGTPSYMSPEQINGKEIDGRSDIFSLGVVFFELLTGQVPFKGKNITNLFYEITQGRHPSPKELNPKIPRPCVQIIDKALSKNPESRFQQAGELAKYLDTLIHKIDESRIKQRAI